MKKIILFAALLFGMNATAQIEIKESPKTQKLWRSILRSQSLKELVIGQDTCFLFLYQNLKYNYITSFESFSFSNSAELIDLLDLCSKVIAEGESFDIELRDESLTLNRRIKSVKITTSKGWLFLDKRNIKKIREALKLK
jgi:hypothetical protein